MRQHLGVLGAWAQCHLPGLFDSGEQGHQFKQQSRASGAIPPPPPSCPSGCSERLSKHRGERDTPFEGEVCKRTVCVGIHDASLWKRGCQRNWGKTENKARSSLHLVVVAMERHGFGVKRMFAEHASALFWSGKILMWTVNGKENVQACLTLRVQIQKHTSPLLSGRWSGFFFFILQMSRICEMSKNKCLVSQWLNFRSLKWEWHFGTFISIATTTFNVTALQTIKIKAVMFNFLSVIYGRCDKSMLHFVFSNKSQISLTVLVDIVNISL